MSMCDCVIVLALAWLHACVVIHHSLIDLLPATPQTQLKPGSTHYTSAHSLDSSSALPAPPCAVPAPCDVRASPCSLGLFVCLLFEQKLKTRKPRLETVVLVSDVAAGHRSPCYTPYLVRIMPD